jgi:integrase
MRTYDGYESIIIHHLKPAFGDIKLKQLHPTAIDSYYGRISKELSPRTIHHIHRVLFKALKYAGEIDFLARNPCSYAHPPKPQNKTMRTLIPDEAALLLDRAKDTRYYPVIYTALFTGMRQGELLGLRWRDVNLKTRSISVCQVLYKSRHGYIFKEPKTERSKRNIKITDKLMTFLTEYKRERENVYFELGTVLGLDSLVFANDDGRPYNPSVLSHDFQRLVQRIGFRGVRFHDLRHTFASLMLLQGANVKVISEALGHSSVAFTLQVYSHVIEGMQGAAMTLLDGVLPAAVTKQKA